jgi:hypothetical protein
MNSLQHIQILQLHICYTCYENKKTPLNLLNSNKQIETIMELKSYCFYVLLVPFEFDLMMVINLFYAFEFDLMMVINLFYAFEFLISPIFTF